MIYNTKSVSLFEFVSITDSEVLSPEFTITVIYKNVLPPPNQVVWQVGFIKYLTLVDLHISITLP